ncbi:MAG: hypothetical protein Q9216_000054 [Gyalolechia sp. 2 TL-2023]
MTRKKKPPSHPKRQQITDSNGWTHIRRSHKPTRINNNSFPSDRKFVPAEIPHGQTLLDLQKSHSYYRGQWLSSPCHQNLQNLLQNDLPSSLRSPEAIDRCIILGLGSLSNGRRSSWWELVFLESVLDFLSLSSSTGKERMQDERLQIYIQDPVFNDLDVAFFRSLGFIILSDPDAFNHISPSTFLFAPHLEIEVFVKALEKARLGLCIGTNVTECMDRYVCTLDSSQIFVGILYMNCKIGENEFASTSKTKVRTGRATDW